MSTYGLLMSAPVVGLLLIAAAVDWRSRKIPNWLTFTLALSGFTQSLTAHALTTPGQSLLGFFVGFALTFLLFAIGALGGGDVKLLAGIGAWFGPQAALAVFCVEAILGAAMVIAQALLQGRTQTLLRNSAMVAINLVHVGEVGVDHARRTGQSCKSIDRPLPYAVPVLVAMLILLAFSWTPGR